VEWNAFAERLSVSGRGRAVLAALLVSRRMLATPLPEPVSALAERRPVACELAVEAAHHLERNVSEGTQHGIGIFRQLRFAESPGRRRARVLGMLLPCVLERRLVRLPRWLWWLYYPIRIMRLVWRVITRRAGTVADVPE